MFSTACVEPGRPCDVACLPFLNGDQALSCGACWNCLSSPEAGIEVGRYPGASGVSECQGALWSSSLYPGGWDLLTFRLLQFSGWSISVDPISLISVRFLGSRPSLGYFECLQSVCRKSILERLSAFPKPVRVGGDSLLSTRHKDVALLALPC